ncbi:MAG: hypothetical protein JOZ17_09035 [Acetobacteraceae bacterium]|nr:hypothetical protein [Acetobacteraceae bacterium]
MQAGLSGAGPNVALVELLENWEDISVEAQQKLGNGPLVDILREYRAKSLPIVRALTAMLPPESRTRRNVEEKIKETLAEISQEERALSDIFAKIVKQDEEMDLSNELDFSNETDFSKEHSVKNVAKEPIARFGTVTEAPPCEQVAQALVNKANSLAALNRFEEEIAVYGVTGRFA